MSFPARTTIVAALALLGAAIALLVLAPDAAAETHHVEIAGFAYDPDELNITSGDTVIWTNNDSTTHTVTADGGEFDSGDITPGDSWNFTFNLEAGDYDYHCEYYPAMEATVNVRGSAEDYEEWFFDWDYDTEDRDEDGEDDTIVVGYDPDTESDGEVNVTVTVQVLLEGSGHDVISANYTISDGEWDDFWQEWGADVNGTFDFEVYLTDEQDNLEDNFTISDVVLHARGNFTRDETLNVDVASLDADDDGLINDLNFFAHLEDDGVADVLIRLFVNDLLYAENTTDDDGETWFYNIPDGDYLWDAYYNDSQLLHEGGLNHIEVALDRGAVGFLSDHDDNDDYDDFLAQVWDNDMEGDPNGYVEVYDENGTLVASGNTNDSAGWWDNVFVVYDLAQGNYTFSIWMEEGGTLLQNGSFYSYGDKGKSDSDEWFADIYYEVSDSDGDGTNDTVTIVYDVDTNIDEMDVEVEWIIEDSEENWEHWDSDDFTVENGTIVYRDMSWTTSREDNYTLYIWLYDENDTMEDSAVFEDIHLGEGEPQGGDSNEWFTDIFIETWDSDSDELNDTATIRFEVDTDNMTPVDVDAWLTVYDSNGDWAGWDRDSHTVVNSTIVWRSLNFTADYNDTYDFEIELYDEDGYFEDYAFFENITLYATGGGGEEEEVWYEDIFHEAYDGGEDGLNDTARFTYDVDTNLDSTSVSVEFEVRNSSWDVVHRERDNFSVANGTVEYRWLEYVAPWNDTYYFSLDLYDSEGEWEENYWVDIYLNTKDETHNDPPSATITDIDPSPAVAGENVTLTGNGTDPDGSVVKYRWESDRDGALGLGETLTLDNLSVGTHLITLRVQDDDGAWSDPANASLRVHERPVASIDDLEPSPAVVGEIVYFNGSGNDDGMVVGYEWRIDDTVVSTDAEFTRDDLAAGLYDISFRVQDDDGAWSVADTATLAVNEPDNEAPTASIDTLAPNPATEGVTVSFAGSGSDPDGSVVAYLWRFNGVEVSTSDSFTRSDLAAGSYSVEFLVRDNDDAWSAADTAVLVIGADNAAPEATIAAMAPNPAEEGERVQFAGSGSDEDGDIEAYEWEIDGVLAATTQMFTRDDLAVGNHTVRFRVQDDGGAWSEWKTATLVIQPVDGGGDDDSPAPGLLAGVAVAALVAIKRRRR